MKTGILFLIIGALVASASADRTDIGWLHGQAGTAVDGDYVFTFALDPGVNILDHVENGTIDISFLQSLTLPFAPQPALIAPPELGVYAGMWNTDHVVGDGSIVGMNVQGVIDDDGIIAIGDICNITAIAGPVQELQPEGQPPYPPQYFNPNTVTMNIEVIPEPSAAILMLFVGSSGYFIRRKYLR